MGNKYKRHWLKSGDRKGCLTLLCRVADFEGECDVRARWLAKCDCGKSVPVINRNFSRLKYHTCGKGCGLHHGRGKKQTGDENAST